MGDQPTLAEAAADAAAKRAELKSAIATLKDRADPRKLAAEKIDDLADMTVRTGLRAADAVRERPWLSLGIGAAVTAVLGAGIWYSAAPYRRRRRAGAAQEIEGEDGLNEQ